MTTFRIIFSNNFKSIMNIIFGAIVLYIILFPRYLNYYFENALGRTAMISFIIAMTYVNKIMGVLTTVIFIGLYNSRTNVEGLENADANGEKIQIVADKAKTTDPKTTEASTPGILPTAVSASPSDDKTVSLPLDKTAEPTAIPTNDKAQAVATTVKKAKDTKSTTEGFNNRLTYSELNEGRNRMLTIENYIRKPRSSNQMSFSKYSETSVEPAANYIGLESFNGVTIL